MSNATLEPIPERLAQLPEIELAAAVAVAVADAVAAAVAAAERPGVYTAVYRKLKPIYEEKIGEKYQTALLDSALDLIKRMSSLELSP